MGFAMTYKIATGHDVALLSLVALIPQPRCAGLMFARRTYAADGSIFQEKAYQEWVFDVLNVTDYQALCIACGIGTSGVLSAQVTIQGLDAFYNFTRFNAIVVRPNIGSDGQRSNFYLRNFTLLFRDLVEITS
jgi:hypothetical protein